MEKLYSRVQASTLTYFSTCPFGQLTKKSTCPTQSFSCPKFFNKNYEKHIVYIVIVSQTLFRPVIINTNKKIYVCLL